MVKSATNQWHRWNWLHSADWVSTTYFCKAGFSVLIKLYRSNSQDPKKKRPEHTVLLQEKDTTDEIHENSHIKDITMLMAYAMANRQKKLGYFGHP